jgi:pimeloyl-ACP methyl ester carboxylesterase
VSAAREIQTDRGRFAVVADEAVTRPAARGSVLMVPGFTGSKEDLEPVLGLLADAGWSAAAYDQRGQYETVGAADDDYSLEGFAADACAVAAAVYGETERVHLVGHSFGGLVAGAAAIQDPLRWASLTLLCSGPCGLHEGSIFQDALLVAETVQRDGLESVYRARRLRDRALGSPPLADDVEALYRRRFLASSPQSLAAIARHLTQAPDRTAELVRLDLPVGLVRGDADTWPRDVQDALAAALDTHVEVIDGAGHSPASEQPEATRDALTHLFLRAR